MMNAIHNEDCLEGMKRIPDGSVDMVLCDLPYGTTACKWDTVIPFEPLWEQYWRVAKKNAAIVLTASQPFTSQLVASNISQFKHEWVWHKDKGANIALMRYQPSKVHESVLVFSHGRYTYNPQMEQRPDENRRRNKPRPQSIVGVQGSKPFSIEKSRGDNDEKFPTSVKYFVSQRRGLHPTQKPVALFEYLIRTYTQPGETVLDNCMGSGTTAIAALRCGRNFIGFEKDEAYHAAACKRIDEHHAQGALWLDT